MKTLLSIILCVLSWSVNAAPPTIPTCTIGDANSLFAWQRYDIGWASIAGCKDTGVWVITPIACRHEKPCPIQKAIDTWLSMGVATTGSAKRQIFEAAWPLLATTDCNPASAADAAICAIADDWAKKETAARNPAPIPTPTPTPTVYQVVKAASNANPIGTRPVYAWLGTKRATTAVSGLRAKEFSPCDCSNNYAEGTSLYCFPKEVVSATPVVTLCEKK